MWTVLERQKITVLIFREETVNIHFSFFFFGRFPGKEGSWCNPLAHFVHFPQAVFLLWIKSFHHVWWTASAYLLYEKSGSVKLPVANLDATSLESDILSSMTAPPPFLFISVFYPSPHAWPSQPLLTSVCFPQAREHHHPCWLQPRWRLQTVEC